MEWSDQTDHQHTNGSSKMQTDSKLINPPDNNETNAEAPPIGPPPDSEEYPMNKKFRGKALIFSHCFKDDPKLVREGNEADERRIIEELTDLSFDVKVHRDQKIEEIKSILKTTSEDTEFHTESDALVVVVMSHGKKVTKILGDTTYEIHAKDGCYNENILFENFNGRSCPALHGKPKIFLIQACRGLKKQTTTLLMSQRAQSDSAEKNDGYYYLPDDADFFIFRATYDGTVSYRNTKTGAYFIQAICDKLSENRNRNYSRDFMTLMTLVILKVATAKAQQPNILSTLTRLLYLRPKNAAKMLT